MGSRRLGGLSRQAAEKLLQEEVGGSRPEPKMEARALREKIRQIEEKADVLLENISVSNRDFVDQKLAKLRWEKRQIEELLEETEKVRYEPIDLAALVADAMASVGRFREILGAGVAWRKKRRS